MEVNNDEHSVRHAVAAPFPDVKMPSDFENPPVHSSASTAGRSEKLPVTATAALQSSAGYELNESMNHYPHPILAREGWPYIVCSVALAIVLSYAIGAWSLPFWLLALFVVQFFRDPARTIPTQKNAVLSPADGRIVVVERTEDPQLKQPAIKVSVFMNVFNVHSNRSPVDGTVTQVNYHAGSFLNASMAKASTENERNAVSVRMDNGTEVTFIQIAGLVARRILCYAKPGDRLARGQRYGFIRFGSRVDVYLPLSATVKVAIGDKVSATHTILAELAE